MVFLNTKAKTLASKKNLPCKKGNKQKEKQTVKKIEHLIFKAIHVRTEIRKQSSCNLRRTFIAHSNSKTKIAISKN